MVAASGVRNQVAALMMSARFTVVGYGLQSVKPVESGIEQRRIGIVSPVNAFDRRLERPLFEQPRTGPRRLGQNVLW